MISFPRIIELFCFSLLLIHYTIKAAFSKAAFVDFSTFFNVFQRFYIDIIEGFAWLKV